MNPKSDLIIMAGPCSVESETQLMNIAEAVKKAGAHYLRGGAWKPRTKGGEWEGLKRDGLKILQRAGNQFDLKIVTEILGPDEMDMTYRDIIAMFRDYGVDVYQVGARNAQNQGLLNVLGEANVPVLLKNGMNTTVREWLGSATRLSKDKTMLCIRGKNNETDVARNGQDIVTIEYLVQNSPYPLIFDPSHITGKREYVYGVTMAAIALGVDGLIVEVHNDPLIARTDGRQSITPKQLEMLVQGAKGQRELFLQQAERRQDFIRALLPTHSQIYFRSADLESIKQMIPGLDVKSYVHEETGVLTAMIPSGYLAKIRKAGYAIGEVVIYNPKKGESSAEAIHVSMPYDFKIKMSPFNKPAVDFRRMDQGKTTRNEARYDRRVELVHGYAGQSILDAFLTIDMGKVPELQGTPLVIYEVVKEK
jgi:3-deoxy-7-phosphoheptulonate synthase